MGRARISLPEGDVPKSAEPLRSSEDDAAGPADAGNKVKRRGRKRKKGSVNKGASDVDESCVTSVMGEESVKAPADEVTLPLQTSPRHDQPDNLVLRKLLRGPRYFDPPDTSWGNCYHCGEQGHKTIDCTAEKKKKPCFYCASTEHTFKKCTKGRHCFICKPGGHKGKDCPERSSNLKKGSVSDKICLRCGDYGHDMFPCKNNYLYNDLKAIQCYACNAFGHLCCYKSTNHASKRVSCYKCGGLGHTGLACARLVGEAAGTISPTLCYSCGQGGHFARECPYPLKACKNLHLNRVNHASSSCRTCEEEGNFLRDCPSSLKTRSRLNGDYRSGKLNLFCRDCGVDGHAARNCPDTFMATKSIDCDTSRRNLKIRYNEDGVAQRSQPRKGGRIIEDPIPSRKTTPKRGRWITEDRTESPPPFTKANKSIQKSPATPTSWEHQIHPSTSNPRQSSALISQVSTEPYRQRFPASRFFNFNYNNTSKVRTNDRRP